MCGKMRWLSALIFILDVCPACHSFPFMPQATDTLGHRKRSHRSRTKRDAKNDDDDWGIMIDDVKNSRKIPSDTVRSNVIDPHLRPPLVNLRKESILFGQSPATVANNNMLKAWKFFTTYFPYVITGVKPQTANDQTVSPIGGMYNIFFVRVPTILAGLLYLQNLALGYPLVMDLGYGSFEVNPFIVGSALYILLR